LLYFSLQLNVEPFGGGNAWSFSIELEPRIVIPAKERVKESAAQLKSGPQRRPRAGVEPYKSLFQLDKWIPAFAGMTLRDLTEGCNFDFFTRSKAGIHICTSRSCS